MVEVEATRTRTLLVLVNCQQAKVPGQIALRGALQDMWSLALAGHRLIFLGPQQAAVPPPPLARSDSARLSATSAGWRQAQPPWAGGHTVDFWGQDSHACTLSPRDRYGASATERDHFQANQSQKGTLIRIGPQSVRQLRQDLSRTTNVVFVGSAQRAILFDAVDYSFPAT